MPSLRMTLSIPDELRIERRCHLIEQHHLGRIASARVIAMVLLAAGELDKEMVLLVAGPHHIEQLRRSASASRVERASTETGASMQFGSAAMCGNRLKY